MRSPISRRSRSRYACLADGPGISVLRPHLHVGAGYWSVRVCCVSRPQVACCGPSSGRIPGSEKPSPELVGAWTAADSRSSKRTRDRAAVNEVASAQEAEDFEQHFGRQAVKLRVGRRRPRPARGAGRVASITRCWRRRCFDLISSGRTTSGVGASRAEHLANIPATFAESSVRCTNAGRIASRTYLVVIGVGVEGIKECNT